MATRAIAWIKEGGAEFADVLIAGERQTATGVAIGAEPIGYRGFTVVSARMTSKTASVSDSRGDALIVNPAPREAVKS